MDTLASSLVPLRWQLEASCAAQPAGRALIRLYGISWLSRTIISAERGDCQRFRQADQVVRFAGLDVTVRSSNTKRVRGQFARQGSLQLRGALFEAAKCAAREGSPDHASYTVL